MALVLLLFAVSPMGVARAGNISGVIASGLNNPRGITLGPDGMLYIAEAGIGGPDLGDNCFEGPEGYACYGESAGVSRVNYDGSGQERLLDNMPSFADPASGVGAIGTHDVAFDEDGQMYATVGLGMNPLSRTANLGPGGVNMGHLARIDNDPLEGYSWENIVDIGQYEIDNNPDENVIDTNPWGLLDRPGGLGKFAMSDAGGNSLLDVNANNGVVIALSVFPTREVSMIPMHAVPVGINFDANGDFYVGQLTGFPFPVGEAYVFSVPSGGGDPTPIQMGFTHAIDVVHGSDGSIFVLQMDDDGLIFGPNLVGSVIQVLPDNSRVTIAENLGLPTGMTLGPDRALYVTVCTQTAPIPVPCIAGMGAVVRVETELPTDVSLSGISGDAAGGPTLLVVALALLVLLPLGGRLALRRRRVEA
jgi:DNA-binding beta-propeller fold protein YncE